MAAPEIASGIAPRHETHALAYAGLTVATVGWAAAFILGKVVLREMTPLALGAWRYLVAALVLLPFVLRATRAAPAPAPSVRGVAPALAVMVIAAGVLYPWLFLAALERTTATNTALLIATNPMVTLLLSPLVGERLGRERTLGGLLAFAGAVLVISRGDLGALVALRVDPGDLLALAAAACWATFNLASRLVVSRVPPATVNLSVFAGGAAALFLLSVGEDPLGQLAHATAPALLSLVAMALLSSVLAGQLFLIGVRSTGVGRAAMFIYLVPVLTAVLSVRLLGEELSLAQIAGGAAVLVGLFLTTRGER